MPADARPTLPPLRDVIAAHGLQAMVGMLPVLRAKSIPVGFGIAARTDRADDNALAFGIAVHVAA